ncbi:hypothetical protein T4B_12524 [Trichinella pseudospiralis]|uniref:Uncharacterized protein n=1 Tax=Trichinella pseudospiralis TaxID=6337 RepID=A0A0V1H8E6_TRIPS|nr:hypothetical protein T4B_12524 [Trichinella pseudospiralis]
MPLAPLTGGVASVVSGFPFCGIGMGWTWGGMGADVARTGLIGSGHGWHCSSPRCKGNTTSDIADGIALLLTEITTGWVCLRRANRSPIRAVLWEKVTQAEVSSDGIVFWFPRPERSDDDGVVRHEAVRKNLLLVIRPLPDLGVEKGSGRPQDQTACSTQSLVESGLPRDWETAYVKRSSGVPGKRHAELGKRRR